MLKLSGVFLIVFAVSTVAGSAAFAKLEYFAKEKAERPEVTCMTCHTAVPKKNDKNTQLNETGAKYQKDKKLPKK